MNFDSVDSLLKHFGVGRLPVNDPLFNDTYEALNVFRRTGITVDDDEDLCHQVMEEFQCSAQHCDEVFHNLADYEIHYNGSHRYSCEGCKITRPNARLLEIHIQENHDSFFQIVSQKCPMYQCYVAECNEKFSSPKERKSHCCTFHKFPENYRFDIKEPNNIDANPDKLEQSKSRILGEKSTENPSHNETSLKLDQPSSNSSEYNWPGYEKSIDDKNVSSSVTNRDTELSEKILPPTDQSTYARTLVQNTRANKNVLETGNMMDLLNELPD